jgi:hypothetical protein
MAEEAFAMARRNQLREILAEGRCTQGAGRAFDVAMMVLEQPRLAPQLVACLWDEDEGVAGRAADALETVANQRPQLIHAAKQELLGLVAETGGLKIRWHLGLVVLRLPLSTADCRRLGDVYSSWLDDPSSIVKTCAMQGLAELTRLAPAMKDDILDLLRELARSGTPAMRARGRHLIPQLEQNLDLTWKRQRPQERAAKAPARRRKTLPVQML